MSMPMPELDGTRHRRVAVGDGVELHVAEMGPPDADPVLLLHGWPQNWWCWSRVAPLLAGEFRCVMPDLRGHGWSDRPENGYEKERFATDMLEVLDADGIERVTFVGHDWGAFAGFLLGIRAPERVRGLLALSIPHLWPSITERVNPMRALRMSYQLPLSAPLAGRALMRIGLARRVLAHGSENFSENDLDVFQSTIGSAECAHATVAMYRTFVLRELPAIALGRYEDAVLDVPARLLVGEDDPVVGGIDSGFERNAPHMTTELVPGAGHFLPQDRPDLIAEETRAIHRAGADAGNELLAKG